MNRSNQFQRKPYKRKKKSLLRFWKTKLRQANRMKNKKVSVEKNRLKLHGYHITKVWTTKDHCFNSIDRTRIKSTSIWITPPYKWSKRRKRLSRVKLIGCSRWQKRRRNFCRTSNSTSKSNLDFTAWRGKLRIRKPQKQWGSTFRSSACKL